MITKTQFSIRSVNDVDQREVANLIHFETHVHRHLDWRPPLEWIGCDPFLVAEENGNIVATLACPPDNTNTAWIRLFASAANVPQKKLWDALWIEARTQLIGQNEIVWAAAIPLQPWFKTLVKEVGYEETQKVVLLDWENGDLPPDRPHPEVRIETMTVDDLECVHQIDELSFAPIWINSRNSLEHAFKQASVATVGIIDRRIIGYQISTATPVGGHLARLAVHPEHQAQGIGYAILRDLLQRFEHRESRRITVNTQQDNLASLALYKKAGFNLTGEQYPVYVYSI